MPRVAQQNFTHGAMGGTERRKVLKETILSGIVLAFMPRRQKGNAHIIDADFSEVAPPVSAPIAPKRATHAATDAWPVLTPIEAAKVFYLEMQAHAAGELLQFRWVRHSYDVLAKERGWPALSDKALGTHLVTFGCKKKTVDLRRKGLGRTSAYEFPIETTAQKRRRKK